MKLSMFLFCFLSCSFSYGELNYRPYDFNYNGTQFIRTYLNSDTSMDELLEPRRSSSAEELGLSSFAESEQSFEANTLEDSLNMILNSYDADKILFLTTLKDPTLAIEQRLTDKNSVALEDKPVRQFLQSSYCLVLSPFRYLIDPLCIRERAEAQETINELRNGEIWFEYIAGFQVVKIVLDENNQKSFELYEHNSWSAINSSAPVMKFNSYSVEDLVEKLEVAYYFHSFRRNTSIPTSLFKVYETE